MSVETLQRHGWVRFAHDPAVAEWAEHALPAARAAVADPQFAHWLVCGGTWFVGVNALANGADGAVAGSGALAGGAVETLKAAGLWPGYWDRAQISVVYPGYPRPRDGEAEAAFRYRRNRDAAHLDGLKPFGPDRQRRLDEPHGFILGLPLGGTGPGTSPTVVWDGSHHVMRRALGAALRPRPPEHWREVDLTQAYHAARREAFETCERIELPLRPGEACLIHRLTLHGVTPWRDSAAAPPDGRMIAFFRPDLPGGPGDWIDLP
ncbi:MAG: hypothetical protein GY717_19070 [Rhodobacteraceae bacterium]|nr:hypothetical protein [Paracoccaceae bacterium]